jgi:hypothetical protein
MMSESDIPPASATTDPTAARRGGDEPGRAGRDRHPGYRALPGARGHQIGQCLENSRHRISGHAACRRDALGRPWGTWRVRGHRRRFSQRDYISAPMLFPSPAQVAPIRHRAIRASHAERANSSNRVCMPVRLPDVLVYGRALGSARCVIVPHRKISTLIRDVSEGAQAADGRGRPSVARLTRLSARPV